MVLVLLPLILHLQQQLWQIRPIFFIVIVGVLAATISAMIIGRMLGLYPIETGISVGLCSCNIGGSGDLAVLMAANRMNLLPFASISTRIGGALMLVWISLLMPMFVK